MKKIILLSTCFLLFLCYSCTNDFINSSETIQTEEIQESNILLNDYFGPSKTRVEPTDSNIFTETSFVKNMIYYITEDFIIGNYSVNYVKNSYRLNALFDGNGMDWRATNFDNFQNITYSDIINEFTDNQRVIIDEIMEMAESKDLDIESICEKISLLPNNEQEIMYMISYIVNEASFAIADLTKQHTLGDNGIVLQAGFWERVLCNSAATGIGAIYGAAVTGMISGSAAGPIGAIVGGATSVLISALIC